VIKLEQLKKTYRMGEEVIHALDGVDLEIPGGEFLAIVGPSGSGKSTLLHIVGGLDSPTSGKVIVNGNDLSRSSDKELADHRNHSIGFIFQSFNLHPTYNSLENVALPLIFARVSAAQRKKLAWAALEEVGLTNRAYHKPNQLSGGERQRVCIARALVLKPGIILADEPTGNLDSVTGEHVVEILSGLNKEKGITLIMVTHNPDLAKRANHQLFMADGHVVEERKS